MFSASNLENIWDHDTIAKLQRRRRLRTYTMQDEISKKRSNFESI